MNRSVSVCVVVIIMLFLFITFMCDHTEAFASDQKLVHGAGTLPHLTSAFTVSMGGEIPTPIMYALRYDIGLGNRVQLGLAASAWGGLGWMIGVEVHSMFNVLKTASDSDFLSLYLNPGLFILDDFLPELFGSNNFTFFLVRPGVAYEHRFGDKRPIGLYVKAGAVVLGGGDDQWRIFRFGTQSRGDNNRLQGGFAGAPGQAFFNCPGTYGKFSPILRSAFSWR